MTACVRCRQKKRRCDQQRPTCRLCKLAGAVCVEYDVTAKRQIPRSYVPSLERRIAYLESRLRENGIYDIHGQGTQEPNTLRSAHSTPSSTLPPLALEDETTQPNTALSPVSREEVERVVGLARSEPGQECSFSQVLLTELIHSTGSPHIQRPQSTASDSSKVAIPSDIAADLDTSSVPLTSRDKAESLTRAYFQFTSLNLPLLHEPTFREKLDLVYSMPTAVHLRDLAELQTDAKSRIAIFFVLEVFAVALLRMQKQDPSRISTSLADRYHKTALDALNLVSLPNDVEGVQALLLIALYSYHHPNLWATWRTVGAALRLAVELGLHQDVSDGLDPLALDTRRRAFWVPYSMDRNLSAAMSLPSGLSDGAISTQFPSDVADEFITPSGIISTSPFWPKTFALHMFRYRQIQSELRSMLWERLPPCAQIDLGEWQSQMRGRIDGWYNSTPIHGDLSSYEKGVLETLEATHYTAVFHLYRPSPNNPSPSGEQAAEMAQAAVRMIHLYQRFFRRHMLSIYWRSIENIFSAGTALMLAYIQFPDVREVITLSSLESLIHTCSSLLWGMVERFPSFQGKRDAFDIAASKALEEPKTTASEVAGSVSATTPGSFVAGQSGYLSALPPVGETATSQSNEHDSWLQFLTPDDFTYHLDQESALFQDLDLAALLGNIPATPGAHFH